jgi:hypothetical protein
MSPRLTTLFASCIFALSLEAAPTDFSNRFTTPADFEDNFVALRPSGDVVLKQDVNDLGLGLRKSGAGTVSIIYDSSAEGATGGKAGTSGKAANADYLNTEVGISARYVDFSAPSVGIWTRVPADYSSGYLGLVNMNGADSIRLRIFGSGSTPLSASPGKVLEDVTITPPVRLDNSSLYRIILRTTGDAESIRLELIVRDLTGAELAAAEATQKGGSILASGQIGLRISSKTLILDDFSIQSLQP